MSYLRKSTSAEVLTGTSDDLAVTPLGLRSNVWYFGGNAVSTSEKSFGTTTNFDIPIIRNSVEKMRVENATWTSSSYVTSLKIGANSSQGGIRFGLNSSVQHGLMALTNGSLQFVVADGESSGANVVSNPITINTTGKIGIGGVASPATTVDYTGTLSKTQSGIRQYFTPFVHRIATTSTGRLLIALPTNTTANYSFTFRGTANSANISDWTLSLSFRMSSSNGTISNARCIIEGFAPFETVYVACDLVGASPSYRPYIILGEPTTEWVSNTAIAIIHAMEVNTPSNALDSNSWLASVLPMSIYEVRPATTANITLSGIQTIDSYAGTAGDKVLVKNQTNPTENGIYIMQSGAWTRDTNMDTFAELTNMYIRVKRGTTQSNTLFYCDAPGSGTIGVDNITFSQYYNNFGSVNPLLSYAPKFIRPAVSGSYGPNDASMQVIPFTFTRGTHTGTLAINLPISWHQNELLKIKISGTHSDGATWTADIAQFSSSGNLSATNSINIYGNCPFSRFAIAKKDEENGNDGRVSVLFGSTGTTISTTFNQYAVEMYTLGININGMENGWGADILTTEAGFTTIRTLTPLTYNQSSSIFRIGGSLQIDAQVYDSTGSAGTGTNQVLSRNGSGNLVWKSISDSTFSNITGSGTTNYIAKFTSGNTIGDSPIFDLNGSIGIGTNNPQQTLHVVGAMRLTSVSGTPTSIIGRSTPGDIGTVSLGTGLSLSGGVLSTSGVISGSGTLNYVPKFTSSSAIGDSIIFSDTSAIGISTASPQRTLHVNGTLRVATMVGVTPNAIMGRDGNGDVTTIVVGNGLLFSSGTLSFSGNTVTEAFIEGQTGTSFDMDANSGVVKDVNGNNISFTLPSNLSTLYVYRNGVLQLRDGTSTTRDYSVNTGTNVITFTTSISSDEIIYVYKTT